MNASKIVRKGLQDRECWCLSDWTCGRCLALEAFDEMQLAIRRAEAFAAFLELVTEYGTAKINCDMESYGREPGDIVTVLVAAPLGGYYSSREIEFTPEAIQRFRERIAPQYEADAALLTGETP